MPTSLILKAMSFLYFTFFLLVFLPVLPSLAVLPNPDPANVQTQTLLPSRSPPATIPAFPEQSDAEGCPLDLPDELFHGIKSACGSRGTSTDQLHRTRCCPVLAAWLYSAYSRTALHRAIARAPQSTAYDMPLLPDDSETCVDTLEKALATKGMELVKPNETCDAVYCYCGIRLHPFSCPEAFSTDSHGQLVGDESVKRLERDCLSNNGYTGLVGCSKCLSTLYLLNGNKVRNASESADRTSKMRSRDCELMGLTWLLNKNRTAYIHTASTVLRAFMMSTDGSNPQSCTLNSDGMPLAVDSSEIDDESSSTVTQVSLHSGLLLLLLLFISFIIPRSN